MAGYMSNATGLNDEPSLAGSQRRQLRERSIQNLMAEEGRQKRLAGQVYREARRSNDPDLKMRALEMLQKNSARMGSGGGISQAGAQYQAASERFGRMENEYNKRMGITQGGVRERVEGDNRLGTGQGGGMAQEQVGNGQQQRLSFDEQDRLKRERLTQSGAFGEGARMRNSIGKANSLINSAIGYEIGGDFAGGNIGASAFANEDVIKSSLDKVRELGGTEESFRNAIANRMQGRSMVQPNNFAQPTAVLPPTNAGNLLNPPTNYGGPNPIMSQILSELSIQDTLSKQVEKGRAIDKSFNEDEMINRYGERNYF